MNLGPKSLNAVLHTFALKSAFESGETGGWNIPKKTPSVCGDEMNTVFVCPVIDLELFTERYAGKDNNLHDISVNRWRSTRHGGRTWKPLILSTVIS